MRALLKHRTVYGQVLFVTFLCLQLLLGRIDVALAGTGGVGDIGKTYIGTQSAYVYDPISAGSGAYYFSLPLLSLGGLLDLRFELLYRSELSRFYQYLPGPFWWFPFAYGDLGIKSGTSEYGTVFLPNGDQVSFQKNASGEWVLTNPTVEIEGITYRDNVPPSKYKLKETADFAYVIDPVKEVVYIFEKLFEMPNNNWYFRIVRIVDRNGNQIIHTYNTVRIQQPIKIEDGLGRFLNFAYESVGPWNYMKAVTDHGSRQIEFNYEAQGADNDNQATLRSVRDAMGQTAGFQYSGQNLIAGRTFPEGNQTYTQVYGNQTMYGEEFPRVTSQKDAYNNTANLSYGGSTGILTVNRPDGSVEKYEHYSSHGLLKSLTDPTNKKSDFTKDAGEHMTSVKDRIGDTSSFTYHPETGKLVSITNAKGKTLTYTYTAQDQALTNPLLPSEQITFTFYNLTRVDYPDGTNEQFSYDAKGNMTQRIDQAGKIWTYTYNGRGQVLTITNPAGGVVTYTYNADATLASSRDSDTGTTTYTYDTYKRLTRTNRPDGAFVQIAYNLNDQITSITDENNHTYSYEYDANGNLIRVTDPAGNQTRYAYDLMDRVNEVTNRLGKVSTLVYNNMRRLQSATDPNGLATNLGYDTRGWLNSLTLGGKTWQTGYDNEGIVSSTKTPLNYTTTYQSDKLGFVTGITNPLSQTTTLTRDDLSRITAITDPLNRTTTYAYDSRGLLSGVTLPGIGTATYTRNDQGSLSQITDLNGSHWAFAYTDADRRQSSTDPLGSTWQYSYDTRGRPSITTFPGGATAARTYDAAGNITRLLYSEGPDLQFTYDSLNRLLTANDLIFSRDAEGRVTHTENPGASFGATYDDGGRLKTVTYPSTGSGQILITVTYTYDATMGLLSRVTDSLTGAQVDFTYDNDRRMIGIARSNGVNTTLTWDNASRLTRIKDGPSTGSGIIDLQYALDAAGQITQAKMTVPLDPAGLLEMGTDSFTYDAASRVNTSGYTYDQRGRLTSAPGNSFTWDGVSRLTGINSTILTYNGIGNLVTRAESGATIHYFYNYAIGLNPIVAEKNDTSGQFLRYYVWTPGGSLLYMIDASDGNKVYFYHFDRMGSTLALTNQSGAVTDSYAYDPYGELLGHQGSNPQPFTFVGQYGVRQEGESGTLYHMRARYYDATTQRFISREPIWPAINDPKTINPYQYAAENPISYIDPGGMWMGKAIKWALKKVGGEAAKEVLPDYADLAEMKGSGGDFALFFAYTVLNPDEALEYGLGEHIAEEAEAEQDRMWEEKLGPQRQAREQERIRKQEEARMAEAWKDPEKEAAMLKSFVDKFRDDKEKASLIKRAQERLDELAKARHQGNRETPLKILWTPVPEADRPIERRTLQSEAIKAFYTGRYLTDPLLKAALTLMAAENK